MEKDSRPSDVEMDITVTECEVRKFTKICQKVVLIISIENLFGTNENTHSYYLE